MMLESNLLVFKEVILENSRPMNNKTMAKKNTVKETKAKTFREHI